TDQLKSRLGLALFGVTINVILDLFFLWRGYGAVGAAIGSTLSYCVYAGVVFQSSAQQLYGRRSAGLWFVLQLLLVSGALTLVLNALSRWDPIGAGAGQSLVVRVSLEGLAAVVKMILYGSVTLLLYLVVFRSYQPRREISRMLGYVVGAVRSN